MRNWAIRAASTAVQAAALVAYLLASSGEGALLIAFACLAAGQFLSALVHESGHALAALACRWRIILFVVRPIGLQLPNRNLAMIPKGYNDGAGGWVTAVPRAAVTDTRRNWAIFVAAGPVASFLLAAFAFFVWPDIAPAAGNGIAYGRLGVGLALQALHGFLFSLLPMQRPWVSDGEALRALFGGEDHAKGRAASWVLTLLDSNVRLRAIPDWMIAEARSAAPGCDGTEQWLAGIEIGRALDRAPVDAARARALIDAYRARYGADGWLAACDAWLAAIWEGNVDRAKAALEGPQSAPGVPELTSAAEAAVAAQTGEAEMARVMLDAMMAKVKKKSPFRNPTFRDIRRQVEGLLAKPALSRD